MKKNKKTETETGGGRYRDRGLDNGSSDVSLVLFPVHFLVPQVTQRRRRFVLIRKTKKSSRDGEEREVTETTGMDVKHEWIRGKGYEWEGGRRRREDVGAESGQRCVSGQFNMV